MKSSAKFIHFHSRKCIWKCRLENGGHLSRPQCVKLIWQQTSRTDLMRSDNCIIPLCCRLIKLESRSMQCETWRMGRLKWEKREGWVMWCMQCNIWENIWEMPDNYIVCHIFEHIVSILFPHLLMKITVTCSVFTCSFNFRRQSSVV